MQPRPIYGYAAGGTPFRPKAAAAGIAGQGVALPAWGARPVLPCPHAVRAPGVGNAVTNHAFAGDALQATVPAHPPLNLARPPMQVAGQGMVPARPFLDAALQQQPVLPPPRLHGVPIGGAELEHAQIITSAAMQGTGSYAYGPSHLHPQPVAASIQSHAPNASPPILAFHEAPGTVCNPNVQQDAQGCRAVAESQSLDLNIASSEMFSQSADNNKSLAGNSCTPRHSEHAHVTACLKSHYGPTIFEKPLDAEQFALQQQKRLVATPPARKLPEVPVASAPEPDNHAPAAEPAGTTQPAPYAEAATEEDLVDFVLAQSGYTIPRGEFFKAGLPAGALGGGGFGTVYKATGVGGDCAVKLLKQFSQQQASVLEEVRIMGLLHHPSIVQLIEAMTYAPHDWLFIAMEFIDGADLLHAVLAQPQTFSEDYIRPLLFHIACGLGHAHEYGVMHRDIKPENIMLCRDGFPKLADFGLSRFIEADAVCKTVAGTPGYMAPEIQDVRVPYDFHADIYSLGLVAADLLHDTHCCHWALASLPAATMEAYRKQWPSAAPLPQISEELAALARQMISEVPGERPSACDVCAQISGLDKCDPMPHPLWNVLTQVPCMPPPRKVVNQSDAAEIAGRGGYAAGVAVHILVDGVWHKGRVEHISTTLCPGAAQVHFENGGALQAALICPWQFPERLRPDVTGQYSAPLAMQTMKFQHPLLEATPQSNPASYIEGAKQVNYQSDASPNSIGEEPSKTVGTEDMIELRHAHGFDKKLRASGSTSETQSLEKVAVVPATQAHARCGIPEQKQQSTSTKTVQSQASTALPTGANFAVEPPHAQRFDDEMISSSSPIQSLSTDREGVLVEHVDVIATTQVHCGRSLIEQEQQLTSTGTVNTVPLLPVEAAVLPAGVPSVSAQSSVSSSSRTVFDTALLLQDGASERTPCGQAEDLSNEVSSETSPKMKDCTTVPSEVPSPTSPGMKDGSVVAAEMQFEQKSDSIEGNSPKALEPISAVPDTTQNNCAPQVENAADTRNPCVTLTDLPDGVAELIAAAGKHRANTSKTGINLRSAVHPLSAGAEEDLELTRSKDIPPKNQPKRAQKRTPSRCNQQ